MSEELITVRLTLEQVRLVRKLISEKCRLVSQHPMPEDGDLKQRLFKLDEPFHFAWVVHG